MGRFLEEGGEMERSGVEWGRVRKSREEWGGVRRTDERRRVRRSAEEGVRREESELGPRLLPQRVKSRLS